MKQWDIFKWSFPGAGDHPAVIVSAPDRISNKKAVNVLLCSSRRSNRLPRVNEVLLDAADGLDWETLCKCDFLFSAEKPHLTDRKGNVSPHRRRAIVERIIQSMNWVRL